MWRHIKRGGLYEVLTHSASMQCSTHAACEKFFEGEPWTVYRDAHHPEKVYFRLTAEFLDGRFKEVAVSAHDVVHEIAYPAGWDEGKP